MPAEALRVRLQRGRSLKFAPVGPIERLFFHTNCHHSIILLVLSEFRSQILLVCWG